jgi:hypothetical protein
MKSLLIIINWLLAFLSMSIDTEQSSLWAVAACVAWMGVATWLLVKYASPTEAIRLFARIRRFWQSLWRPKFDFGEFNRKLAREIEAEKETQR